MNIVSVLFTLLYLHSSVSSQHQENEMPSSNQDFLKELSPEKIYFLETFNNKDTFSSTWILSQALKATEDGGTLKYDGDWILEEAIKDALTNDIGLTFKEKAKHRAISSKLSKEFVFRDKPFILQYEVLHQDGQECGGAYMKLISKQRPVKALSDFNDKTPYTIMFGPDKCPVSKLHFIFRHKNPLNGSFEEKHCKPLKSKIDESFTDSKPHLFKLVIKPDNTFSIYVDHKLVNDGSLLEDFTPSVNPPSEIDDPSDKKPTDWDDREKIYDPSAQKPDDWNETAPYQILDPNAVKPDDWLDDEPVNIRDPSAEKPDDWDNEMDGEWEAPLVPNPACEEVSGCGPWSPPLINNPEYKGKWVPPLIDNPNYKGVWTPRKIPNPDYFEDKTPFQMSSIDALGFELWSISAKIMFDNVLITDDEAIAKKFAALTYDKKILNIEKSADTLLNQFIAFTNQYPWLWALYVVILLIPVTLIVVCCFWTTKDTDAEHKKDDDKPQSSVNSSSQPSPVIQESNTKDENPSFEIQEPEKSEPIVTNDDETHEPTVMSDDDNSREVIFNKDNDLDNNESESNVNHDDKEKEDSHEKENSHDETEGDQETVLKHRKSKPNKNI